MFYTRQRISILFFVCLALCATGACAAGTPNHSLPAFSESIPCRYGQLVTPTPYPALSSCLADPSCTDLLIVGHRGTVHFAPENTLTAFERAIELGVDVIELDVRNTADGYLVVIHDATVDRTTDGHGNVDEMTLEEVKALNITSSYPCIPPPPQKVPTFREALIFLKGQIPIDVDVKTDLLEEIVAEVEDLDMLDQAYMLTKSPENGHRFLTANPVTKLQARAHSSGEVYRYIEELHPMTVQVDFSFMTPEIVEAIHASGAKVFLDANGSFDSLGQAGYAVLDRRGVDVIETDRLPVAVHYARTVRE